MASSRKSSRSRPALRDLAARVAAQVRKLVRPSTRVVVGLSGGVDSVVLLDCLHRAARSLGIRLSALHVDHQLSPHSRRWSAHCRRICAALGIPYKCVRVSVRRGNSTEAAAREARSGVFAGQRCDYIALAHHKDDQVETLLLQLLRGAGVKGLAAMPLVRQPRNEARKRPGKSGSSGSGAPPPQILRPMIDVTRREILAYATRRGLNWIEDESNLDASFARNFLRHDVLPLVERRFPAYRETLARTARHLAEAAKLLDELALADGAAHRDRGALAIAGLRALSAPRARNLLRYFLAQQDMRMLSADRLDEALRQVLHARRDARVAVAVDGFELRRFKGRLYIARTLPRLREGYARRWRGERKVALPELGGVLAMDPARGRGISRASLRGHSIEIRVRRGGERLQPDPRRPRRGLKNLLQEQGVPPWERERLPLLFCDGELVWAAGLGVDKRFQASGREASIRPHWAQTA